jgi:hypothetical protein
MKEELVEKLNESGVEAITSVLEFMKSGTNFVAEQAPLYVQELLQWGFYDNLISAIIVGIFSLIFLIASALSFRKMIKEDEPPLLIIVGVFAIFSIGFFIDCVSNTKECIKIKVAPRVYIIESLTNKITK